MLLLNGKIVRDKIAAELKRKILELGRPPALAIIQIGRVAASDSYIKGKQRFAEDVAARVFHLRFPESVPTAAVAAKIRELNADPAVQGIILQLPIPPALDWRALVDGIAAEKDADGLTERNAALLARRDPGAVVPATARGVLSLLSYYKISVAGKKAAVLGRSALVGAPVAALLRNEGAAVTVCHRGTSDVPGKTRAADIVVAAVGVPRFVTREYLSPGQTVVDVGINSVEEGKLEEEIPRRKIVGDVDFENVKDLVGAISPVPGGVGPMTIASLFENLVKLAEKARKDNGGSENRR